MLSQVRPQKNSAPKLMAYVTPKKDDWPPELRALRTRKDFDALSIIHLNAEYTVVRGGKAPVTNLKKSTVVRARWVDFDVEHRLTTDAQRTAFRWLMANNDVYAFYVRDFRSRRLEVHQTRSAAAAAAAAAATSEAAAEGNPRREPDRDMWKRLWPAIPTAELLLKMPGVEIAMRPWLYPTAAFGDTDIQIRLGFQKRRLALNAKANLKTSFFRKLTSRCVSYEEDFPLQCLLYDVALAKQLQGISAKAAKLKLAPDALPRTQNFANFWMDEKEKLEDICRQHDEMPNLFFTVAPAEWKYPTHCAMPGWRKAQGQQGPDSLSGGQVTMALHMYHCLDEILQRLFTEREICRRAVGIEDVRDCVLLALRVPGPWHDPRPRRGLGEARERSVPGSSRTPLRQDRRAPLLASRDVPREPLSRQYRRAMRTRRTLSSQIRHRLHQQGLGRAPVQGERRRGERRGRFGGVLAPDLPHALQECAAPAGDGLVLRSGAAHSRLFPGRQPLRADSRQQGREQQQTRLQRLSAQRRRCRRRRFAHELHRLGSPA